MAPAQAPPTKLFREEGKTGAIECPGCGAPITLRGFGVVEQVACGYCGTVCKPEAGGNLDVLQQAQRQHRPSVLPIGQRGELDGISWEILGITWREVVADGVTYPWQEFLLFNPYEGFRWLIYNMADGVWSFGGALPGAPEMRGGMAPIAVYAGESYKHFSSGDARTTYVEGEFPWQVLAGDVASTNDYVCPPKLISIEVQRTAEGSDVNFTKMRPITAAEVWAAFRMSGSPPDTAGIHPAAINPHESKFFVVAAVLLFAGWVAALMVYGLGRDSEQVYKGTIQNGVVLTQELEIGAPGKLSNLEISVRAMGMNNSWAAAEILLVDTKTEEATAVGVDLEYYSGVDGGESWTEGSIRKKLVIGGIEGGSYMLQVTPQFDTSGDPADALELVITRDVPMYRYMFVPLFVIIAFPAFNYLRRAAFETKRWASSDHAVSASSWLEED